MLKSWLNIDLHWLRQSKFLNLIVKQESKPCLVLLLCSFCLVGKFWLFCNYMGCIPLGSSVHGISQTRILEWVAISFSRESSQARDQTHVSCISRWVLYHWATREAPVLLLVFLLIWHVFGGKTSELGRPKNVRGI